MFSKAEVREGMYIEIACVKPTFVNYTGIACVNILNWPYTGK